MTSTASVLNNVSTPQTAKSDAARSKLSSDYNNFLLMLTTQLKNQDPLDPMDSNEFTNQLVQFANVEQSITTNTHLEKLVNSTTNKNLNQAIDFLGKNVEVESSVFELKNGSGGFLYDTDKAYSKVQLIIKDSSGTPVRTISGDKNVGIHNFIFDGKDDNKLSLPNGYYSITALGIDDKNVGTALGTVTKGTVTSVGHDGDTVMVTVNGQAINSDDIIAIKQ
jgi:flagellar basal-body rod modification protein FlgD